MCHILQVLEALDADAQLPLPPQLQPRHACSSFLEAPPSFWSPVHLGAAAPLSSLQSQDLEAQTAIASQAAVSVSHPAQRERAFTPEVSHQQAQPSLLVASGVDVGAAAVPTQGNAVARISEDQRQQRGPPSAGFHARLPSQLQHGIAPTQEAQEHAAARRPDTRQTDPPASVAHAPSSPSLSFQPFAQQPAAAQSGMLQPFLGSGAQAGIARSGRSPQQRLAQPGQAGQMGVLQSGSSEELARALADLTQMVSCARSDHALGASPGAARPDQPAQFDAFLVPARTEQQLPGQQHMPHSQVHAGQQMYQHIEPESRLELDTSMQPSGAQTSATVQLEGSAIRRQGTQQPAAPVIAQRQRSGCDHEGKRKRDNLQVCTAPQQPGRPSATSEDAALPSKKAKLDGSPPKMNYRASQMPPLQTQSGACVAHGSPAGISYGAKLPPAAQAWSLHAALRCAPEVMPHITVLTRMSMHA